MSSNSVGRQAGPADVSRISLSDQKAFYHFTKAGTMLSHQVLSRVSGTGLKITFPFDDTGWELIYKTEGKMEHHISGQGGSIGNLAFFLQSSGFFRGEHPQEFSSEMMNSGLPAVFNKINGGN